MPPFGEEALFFEQLSVRRPLPPQKSPILRGHSMMCAAAKGEEASHYISRSDVCVEYHQKSI